MKPRSMKHASACLGLLAIAAWAGAVGEALAQPLPVTYEDVTKFPGLAGAQLGRGPEER